MLCAIQYVPNADMYSRGRATPKSKRPSFHHSKQER